MRDERVVRDWGGVEEVWGVIERCGEGRREWWKKSGRQ